MLTSEKLVKSLVKSQPRTSPMPVFQVVFQVVGYALCQRFPKAVQKMSFRINGCVTTMREARVCQGMPGHTLALPAARQLPLPCCHISYIKDWLASGKVLVLGFNLVHIHLYQLSSYTDS